MGLCPGQRLGLGLELLPRVKLLPESQAAPLWTLLWPMTCRELAWLPRCPTAPLVLHMPVLAPTWDEEGPGDITGGTGLSAVLALGEQTSWLEWGGVTADLCLAPATIPSLPSNLVETPGVKGTVWSNPLGSSRQRLSPVERRLGVGHGPCLRFQGYHPPWPTCPIPEPWPSSAGIVYTGSLYQPRVSPLGHRRPGFQICLLSKCCLGQASWRRGNVRWVLKNEEEFAKPDYTKPQIHG